MYLSICIRKLSCTTPYSLTTQTLVQVAKISDEASDFDASLTFTPSYLEFVGDTKLNTSIESFYDGNAALCGGLY